MNTTTKTTETPTLKLSDLPQPPEGSVFSLVEVKTVTIPHLYCITSKHRSYASDHGGLLSKDAIREAERRGACCDICRQRGQILTIDQHESFLSLIIRVPQNKDLNAVPGLHSYLYDNKPTFTEKGIQGFAFPLSVG